jgi:hypothetical protein
MSGTTPPNAQEAAQPTPYPAAQPTPSPAADFWIKIWERSVATITALVLLVGGFFGGKAYFDQREKDGEQRQKEYQLALHKERAAMYHPLCKAAGDIASSTSRDEADPAIKKFLSLYYSEIHIVLDDEDENRPAILEAMIQFSDDVTQDFFVPGGIKGASPQLKQSAQALAKACQKSLDLKKVYANK